MAQKRIVGSYVGRDVCQAAWRIPAHRAAGGEQLKLRPGVLLKKLLTDQCFPREPNTP